MTPHPSDQALALLSGGDLRGIAAWRTRRHVSACSQCAAKIAEINTARDALREAASELPPGVDWQSLSSEIRANVAVGLEAGEAVASLGPRPARLDWRMAIALASLAAVVVAGWVLSVPKLKPRPFATVASGSSAIEVSPAGVELKRGEQGITLLHPRANRVSYNIGPDSAEARFVDVDTGQVTITHVSLD